MVEGTYAMEQIFIDEETGESLLQSIRDNLEIHDSAGSVNNVETGEPEVNFIRIATQRSRKVPFQVTIFFFFFNLMTCTINCAF